MSATNWTKNVLKSLGFSTQKVFSNHLENTIELFKENKDAISEFTYDLKEAKRLKSEKLKSEGKKEVAQSIKTVIKWGFDDLKSGKLYNKERIEQQNDAAAGFGDLDFDMDFDFDDGFDMMDLDDESEGGDVSINVPSPQVNLSPVVEAANATTRAILETTDASIQTSAKMTEATISSMSALTGTINTALATVNENVGTLISFNNENVSKFMETTVSYQNASLKMMGEILTELKKTTTIAAAEYTKFDKKEDLFDNGGLNLKAYMDYVKNNLKEATSPATMMLSMLDIGGGIEGAFASPLESLVTDSIEKIIPTVLTKSLDRFDETISNFFPALAAKIAGLDGGLDWKGMLSRIFGVTQDHASTINTSMYEKGAVPFDGYTRKAIVEVIPTYLSKILSAVSGKEEYGYDYKEGRFASVRKLQERFTEEREDAMLMPFGQTMSEMNRKASKIIDENGNSMDLSSEIRKMFLAIAKENGIVTANRNQRDGTQLSDLLRSQGIDVTKANILEGIFSSLPQSEQMAISGIKKFESGSRVRQFMRDAEKSQLESNAQYSFNRADKFSMATAKEGKEGYIHTGLKDKYGFSSLTYLHDIRHILLKGVKVFVQEGREPNYSDLNEMVSPVENEPQVQERPLTDEERRRAVSGGRLVMDPNQVLTPEDYRRFFENEEEPRQIRTDVDDEGNEKKGIRATIVEFLQKPAEKIASLIDKASNGLYNIIFGGNGNGDDDTPFIDRALKIVQDKFNKFSNWAHEKILDPIREKLFGEDGLFEQIKQSQFYQDAKEKGTKALNYILGEKDDNGIRVGGLISETANEMGDIFREMGHFFTGNEYTDSKGVTHAADPNSVFGEIKTAFGTVKDELKNKFFGNKDEESGEEKEGIITRGLNALNDGFKTISEALFGPKTYTGSDGQEYVNAAYAEVGDIKEKLKNMLPKGLATGIISSVGVGLAGGKLGLLGSLFLGGPVQAMVLGTAAGMLSQSDKFKDFLFGEIDEDSGERIGGFISKQTQKFLKDNKTPIITGAGLGAIKGALGMKVGVLSSFLLPGGPIAGAATGIATSLMLKSNAFQKVMFGELDEDGKRTGGIVGKLFGSFNNNQGNNKKTAGAAVAGGISGLTAGAIISKMGILGATLGPFGPIGGAILGTATGIAAASDRWREAVFGTFNEEEGVREGGLVGKITNFAVTEAFAPLKLKFQETKLEISDWFQRNIANNIEDAFEPIRTKFVEIGVNIANKFSDIMEGIRNRIMETLQPAFDFVAKKIMSPFKKIGSFIGKMIMRVFFGKKGRDGRRKGGLIARPFRMLGAIGNRITGRYERKGLKRMRKQDRSNLFSSIAQLLPGLNEDPEANIFQRLGNVGRNASNLFGDYFDSRRMDAARKSGADIYRTYWVDDGNGGRRKERRLVKRSYIGDREANRRERDRIQAENFQSKKNELEQKRRLLELTREMGIRGDWVNRAGTTTQGAINGLFATLDLNGDDFKDRFGNYDLSKLDDPEIRDAVLGQMGKLSRKKKAQLVSEAQKANTPEATTARNTDTVARNTGTLVEIARNIRELIRNPESASEPDTESNVSSNTDNVTPFPNSNTESEESDNTSGVSENEEEPASGTVLGAAAAAAVDPLKAMAGKISKDKEEKERKKAERDKVTANDYASRQAKQKAENKEKSVTDNLSAINKNTDELEDNTAKMGDTVDGAFGKAGLITLGVVGGVALIQKAYDWFTNNGGLLGVFKSALSGLHDILFGKETIMGKIMDHLGRWLNKIFPDGNSGNEETNQITGEDSNRNVATSVRDYFGYGAPGENMSRTDMGKKNENGLYEKEAESIRNTNMAESAVKLGLNIAKDPKAAVAAIKGAGKVAKVPLKIAGKGAKFLALTNPVTAPVVVAGEGVKGAAKLAGKGGKFVGGKIIQGGKTVAGKANVKLGEKLSTTKLGQKIDAKMASKGADALVDNASDAAKTAAKTAAETGETAAKTAAKTVTEAGEVAAKTASETGESVAKSAAKAAVSSVDDVVEDAAKKTFTKYIDDVYKLFKDWLSSKAVVKIIGKSGVAEFGAKIYKTLFTPLIRVNRTSILKYNVQFGKAAATGAAKDGASVATFGLFEIGEGIWNGVSGALDAANLFHVPKDAVDWKMRTVSSAIKVLFGLAGIAGALVDCIASIIAEVTGINLKEWLATELYKFFSGEKGDEKIKNAKAKFDAEYEKYKEETGNDKLTREAYNDMVNKTTGAKIGDAVKGGLKAVGNFFVGKKTTTYKDPKTNYTYEDAGNGQFKVLDANGKELGYENKANLDLSTMVKTTVTDGGLFTNKTKTVTYGDNYVGEKTEKEGTDGKRLNLLKVASQLNPLTTGINLGKTIFSKFNKKETNKPGTARKLEASNKTEENANKVAQNISETYSDANDNVEKAKNSFDLVLGSLFGFRDKDGKPVGLKEGLNKSDRNGVPYGLQDSVNKTNSSWNTLVNGTSSWLNDLNKNIITWRNNTSRNVNQLANGSTYTYNYGGRTYGYNSSSWSSSRSNGYGGFGTDFPYYSQNDPQWAGASYTESNGSTSTGKTLSERGCGPTAMAMTIGKVTGNEVSPVEMANYAKENGFSDKTGTNWDFVNSAANDYGLDSEMRRKPSAEFIRSQLSSGNPVMLSGIRTYGDVESSPYTSNGHYVVATGLDKNGNVKVNDPRGPEYSKSYSIDTIENQTGAAWSIKNKSGKGGFGGLLRGRRGKFRGGFGLVKDSGVVGSSKTTKAASLSGVSESSNTTIKTDVESAREAVVKAMESIEGKNTYDQTRRNRVGEGLTGHGYGDCSSTVAWAYKTVTGMDIGSNTREQIKSSLGIDVDAPTSPNGYPNESNLKKGDLIFFGKNGVPSHVEMYIGNGQLMGHGSGKGPRKRTIKNYCDYKIKQAHIPYIKARRFLKDGTEVEILSTTGFAQAGSSGNGLLAKLYEPLNSVLNNSALANLTSSIYSPISTIFDSLMGTNSSGSSSDGTSETNSDISAANLSGSDTAEKVWNYFRGLGYSEEATAAIMGNMQGESGMNPASIQGNGKGPAAGIVQWEDYNKKSSRWKAMSDYAAKKGKDWTDLGSQLEYIQKELTSKDLRDRFLGSSTGPLEHAGAKPIEYEAWKTSTDVDMATRQFEAAFERAGKPHMDKRISYAKGFLELYAGKGGNGGGFGAAEGLNSRYANIYNNASAITNSKVYTTDDTIAKAKGHTKSKNTITNKAFNTALSRNGLSAKTLNSEKIYQKKQANLEKAIVKDLTTEGARMDKLAKKINDNRNSKSKTSTKSSNVSSDYTSSGLDSSKVAKEVYEANTSSKSSTTSKDVDKLAKEVKEIVKYLKQITNNTSDTVSGIKTMNKNLKTGIKNSNKSNTGGKKANSSKGSSAKNMDDTKDREYALAKQLSLGRA